MKKGVVVSSRDPLAAYKVGILYPAWYYTWNPTNLGVPIDFIPMVWSAKHLQDIVPYTRTLLGFNEPDHLRQANMSPEEAALHWPLLDMNTLYLGSPAMAGNPSNPDSWMDQFLDLGGNFDFLTLHLYVPPVVEDTLTRVRAAYKKFQKPIWITEMASLDLDQTEVENCQYMNGLLRQLDGLDYVERYVWKDRPGVSALFDEGNITKMGELYHYL